MIPLRLAGVIYRVTRICTEPDTGVLAGIANDGDRDQIEDADAVIVGSKVILPAPGTKTSVQACVEPALADPAPRGQGKGPAAMSAFS